MSAISHLPIDFQKQSFYTPEEVAGIFRIHVSTVREWIRTDHLFAYRLSERVTRIPLSAVMDLLGEDQPVTHRILTAAEEKTVWRAIDDEHQS